MYIFGIVASRFYQRAIKEVEPISERYLKLEVMANEARWVDD